MVEITLFTDPACPFAFSAEPVRRHLLWTYGPGLTWCTRMIVLTREPGEAEKLASGAAGLQARYGMPIDPRPADRPASSEPACRAVVATRRHVPAAEETLLRALRVRTMAGGLLDDPALLAGAATDAGLDPEALARWAEEAETADALERDAAAARDPSPAARALDHKLGGPVEERRYTAPSYELRGPNGSFSLPGFNPVGAYDAAIANLDPTLARRPGPASVIELLRSAPYPLATAEVVMVMGDDESIVRTALARDAIATPVGADAYWSPAG